MIKNRTKTENINRYLGNWLRISVGQNTNIYQCNQCSAISEIKYNFCPNCGSNMKGDENVN